MKRYGDSIYNERYFKYKWVFVILFSIVQSNNVIFFSFLFVCVLSLLFIFYIEWTIFFWFSMHLKVYGFCFSFSCFQNRVINLQPYVSVMFDCLKIKYLIRNPFEFTFTRMLNSPTLFLTIWFRQANHSALFFINWIMILDHLWIHLYRK